MSVVIRLARIGKRAQPYYRIVAIDESSKRNGKPVEELGFFWPSKSAPRVELDKKKLEKWTKVGAQMSDAVKKLVTK